ncbi:hypothetical protein F5J12DRAFT_917367 [Pisolithus orientalis]|uniref:uncharacterized protein n=1 Tax=Pisolithus orientalis TaxID=936130 RepID=UPI002224D8D6|nr:uncharacterized protein F5J12DRAFT_917367 [Pisolithus orientalis]KAI5980690.1 hypothetical protein F5J12DRAFT_917367 [Pisolithus orientalis]
MLILRLLCSASSCARSNGQPQKTHSSGISSWFFPSIFMDALDLSTNVRGVGWNWSKSLRFPPDARPSSRGFIAYVLLSTWYHSVVCGAFHLATQAFSPETFTVLSGGTIFDATLPPLIRYFRSVIITVFAAVAIFAVMQLIYDIATLIGVIVLRQDPAQWPPVFDKPWKADSLRDFWGYRWHQLFRRTFVVVGDGLLGSHSDVWDMCWIISRIGGSPQHRGSHAQSKCRMVVHAPRVRDDGRWGYP